MKCQNCQAENVQQAKYCKRCGKALHPDVVCDRCGPLVSAQQTQSTQRTPQLAAKVRLSPESTSFAGGRYQVRSLLGEGGRKRVYLVHDTVLDRDVAFAQIKTCRAARG